MKKLYYILCMVVCTGHAHASLQVILDRGENIELKPGEVVEALNE